MYAVNALYTFRETRNTARALARVVLRSRICKPSLQSDPSRGRPIHCIPAKPPAS